MEKEEEVSFRKLATIQKITNITPIEGADKIAVAHVLGWEVVIRKEEFNVGDLCVYVETDSVMPALPEFEFLKERKYRVRLIRLRKQVSQGLCLPTSILPKKTFGGFYLEGDDVTEKLGVIKYDPEAAKEARLQAIQDSVHKSRIDKFLKRYAWYRRFFTKAGHRGWPKFIKKTDEERIQRIPNICEKEKGTKFISTEKLDGQSATYSLLKLKRRFWHFKQQHQFIVCSRNIHLRSPNNSSYWTIAKQLDIENILKKLILGDEFIVLQGEIIGEGIQNNKYKIKGYDFYSFNLIHSSTGLDDYFTMDMELSQHNIKSVPLVSDSFILKEDIAKCVEDSKGKSLLQKIHREGLVLRNYQKGISFKIINPDFLLQYQDEIIE